MTFILLIFLITFSNYFLKNNLDGIFYYYHVLGLEMYIYIENRMQLFPNLIGMERFLFQVAIKFDLKTVI